MKTRVETADQETPSGPCGVQQFLVRVTLVLAGALSGIVLYEALFPAFYYLTGFFFVIMLWGLVAAAYLCQMLILFVVTRRKRPPPLTLRESGLRFILGLLLLVTMLTGLKVPLKVSFLLARPGLEEALKEHSDDLTQVAHVSRNYGIYRFRKAERSCHRKDRVYFQFLADGESAIIYSESGIDDLCYNSGSKGHLFGDWYWMKED